MVPNSHTLVSFCGYLLFCSVKEMKLLTIANLASVIAFRYGMFLQEETGFKIITFMCLWVSPNRTGRPFKSVSMRLVCWPPPHTFR